MSLCHLYNKQTSSLHVESLKSSFDGVSLDIQGIDTLDEYDVYIVELNKADKEVSILCKSNIERTGSKWL